MASKWIAYNELAWTVDWLAEPKEYEDEVMVYVNLIRQTAKEPPGTLLHLGSGAGGHDKIFRRYFSVTGADLSSGMLNIARVANPGIEYLEGDMRTLRLNRQFDAVAIPDSIDYMVSQYELRQAVQTAAVHLKTNGVLLLVAKTKETFQNRNFAYTGEKDGVHVTLFSNRKSGTWTVFAGHMGTGIQRWRAPHEQNTTDWHLRQVSSGWRRISTYSLRWYKRSYV